MKHLIPTILLTVCIICMSAGCNKPSASDATISANSEAASSDYIEHTLAPSDVYEGSLDADTSNGPDYDITPNLYGLTFEDYNGSPVHWYSMENQHVYFAPSFQAKVIGELSINDDVNITGYSTNYDNIVNLYPPYDNTKEPSQVSWYRISINGRMGYVPGDYVWKEERDSSISLNALACNYPTINGGGSLVSPPADGKWHYVYGYRAASDVTLKATSSSINIYDGTAKNVLAAITDANTTIHLTGHAYAIYSTSLSDYTYIYEINYNNSIAYIDENVM